MKLIRLNPLHSALAGLIILLVVSCDPSKKYLKEEEEEIQIYLAEHPGLTFQKKPSGLYYLDLVEGTGETPTRSDTAYTFYKGMYLSEEEFDTNVGTTDTLIRPVDEGWLIPGYDEAILYMKEGGKAMVLIPSTLGYGPSGVYFPAYTPILFEIELVKLVQGPAK